MRQKKVHRILQFKNVFTMTLAIVLVSLGSAVANPMVHNSTNLGNTYGDWGVSFGSYGEFDCSTCHDRDTGNIKRVRNDVSFPDSSAMPNGTSNSAVLLQDVREGSSDFGDDSAVGRAADGLSDTSSNKICEICHTQTKFHNYNATLNTVNGGDRSHYNNTNCVICHPHNQGFKPRDCSACHGFPPSTTDNDGSTTTGLAHDPFTTGSTIAGAHVAHATTLSYACENCHDGYSMPDESAVNATYGDVSISFSNFGSTSGSYSGQAAVSYNDAFGDGNVTCATVYCHGSTLDGTDTTPTWTAAGVTCGDCHRGTSAQMDNAAALGSHQMHAGNGVGQLGLACSKCHASPGAAGHVSGVVEWSLDTADTLFGASAAYNGSSSSNSGSRAPSGAYSDCTNVYCHSPGQNSTGGTLTGSDYATPTWGGAVNCGDCHATTTLTSGSHSKHLVATDEVNGCSDCHSGAANDASSYDNASHLDQLITVNSAVLYNAAGALGNGYGTCSVTNCHDDGRSGLTVTPRWGGASPSNCTECHSTISNSGPDNGSHLIHMTTTIGSNAMGCDSCHLGFNGIEFTAVSSDTMPASNHINDTIEVAEGYWTGPNKPKGSAFSTCSNATDSGVGLCHDNGRGVTVATPIWGTDNTDCSTCHAKRPLTGSHDMHLNSAVLGSISGLTISCGDCHGNAVEATTAPTQHGDGDVDVYDSAAGDLGYAQDVAKHNDAVYSSCTSVYCHSDGKTSGWTGSEVTWGATINDCTSCHDEDRDGTGLSGAHAAHFNGATLQTIGKALGCADCHSAVVSNNTTISTPAEHVDGGVDVDSCATQYCHSNGNAGNLVYNSPTFASDTYDCTTCHGNGSDQSYPSYADGGAGTVDSNSHNAHVGNSLISCEECHDDTSISGNAIDGATPAQHVDGGIDVVFKQTGSYDDTANNDTCSTTYCHGAGTPQWGDAGSLNCGSCHSANSSLADSHGFHYNSSTVATEISTVNNSTTLKYIFECGTCHDSTSHAGGEAVSGIQAAEVNLFGSGTYTANSATLGTDNGFKYTAGTCNTNDCHNDGKGGVPNYNGATLQWGVTSLDCTGCHNSNAAAVGNEMATDGHTAHMNDGSIMDNKSCQTCHDDTLDASDTAIADKTVHVNGVVNVAILGTYGGSFSGGNCSSVYCHSDGKATPNYATAKDWTTPISNCTSCHGGANGSSGGDGTATTALSASHTVHTGSFSYTCDDCHAQTASSNSAISTAANHVNQAIDVAVAAANGGTGTIGGDYNGTGCATTNCHGSNSAGAGDSWAAGGTTGNCSLCHGMAASATDDRDTNGDANNNTDPQVGAHEAHLNATHGYSNPIGCDECHVDPNATAGTYVDKVNTAGHMNGTAALTWGDLADGNDNGQSTPAPVSCATTYCHDSSKLKHNYGGPGAVTPVWNVPNLVGDVSDCDNCHGYPPQGAHAGFGNDCSGCHPGLIAATDDGFVDPSTHMNGIVEGSSDSCAGCHSSLSNSHSAHIDSSYFLDGKTISGGDYGKVAGSGTNGYGWYDVDYDSTGMPIIGCGQCHPNTQASHPSGGGAEIDLDGSDELGVLPDPNPKRLTGGAANYTSNRCNNVYCHSDGAGTFDATPPAWGTDTIECDGCHGNSPTTNAHNLHEVGIHYETLLDDDRIGLMAKGTDDIGAADGQGGNYGAGAAHGNTAQATTINCKTCHKDTVQDTANAGNTTCAGCHSDTDSIATGNELARIAYDSFKHINGQVDVVFADMSTFKSKAQLRNDITAVDEVDGSWARYNSAGLDNTAYKQATSYDMAKNAVPLYNSADMTCSTVDCHNSIKTPTWNSASNNCMSCHTKLPQ